MGSSDVDGYCSFTKAVEHLGDRWSLLILRELVQFGPQGFNALATGLPGHVSRSVLRDRLRSLQDLGVVRQESGGEGRPRPYRLTTAGEGLIPALVALRGWSATWLPDDPSMAERDPDIVFAWLGEQLKRDAFPGRQVVLELTMRIEPARHCWLVLARGEEPFGCFEDPLLDPDRYVYVEASAVTFLALARGRRSWEDAMGDGLVEAYGRPNLVRDIPTWFLHPGARRDGTSPATLRMRPSARAAS